MKRLFIRGASWLFQLLVVSGALLALFVALTPQGRASFHAVLFVSQVLELPVRPQAWFTDEPFRHEAHYPSSRGASAAHVYRLPDGEPRAAVVLSLGVTAEGLEDPLVVNLGNALARAGIVVMFDWSPDMGQGYQLDPNEPDNLVSAFLYLEGQEYVDRERVALGGFCVGASVALVAAAAPRIRDRVYLVNAFGPYFDARGLVLQAASRSVVYESERTPWEPSPLTMRVMANELIETLDHAGDAALLKHRYANGYPDHHTEGLELLSQQGRTVSRLLGGVEPEEAEALYSTLPNSLRRDLASISPSVRIADVRARILVLHDRNDRMVPAAESRRLVEAVRERGNFRHTEVLAFDHVTLTDRGAFTLVSEAARLYRHMYEIVRAAS